MQIPDVLIVGAGPVGLTLAAECRRQGVAFRIVDQAAGPSTQSKALAIWSATLEHLTALGVAPLFTERGRPVRRVVFCDAGRVIAKIPLNEGVESVFAQPLILPQSETEELLIGHLRGHGVAVERELECVGIEQDDAGVDCRLRYPNGAVETVRSRWLAGCDGARSIVRHQLPVEFEGVTEKVGFILADARVREGVENDQILILSGAQGMAVIFPVRDDIWRVFSIRRDFRDHSTPTLEEMQGHIDGTGYEGVKLCDPQWLSYFSVNERVVSRNRVGRVFLAGDAAHIHSPAGGQGMNTGMQDAFNLAWKLRLLAGGYGDAEAIAESYNAERHAMAEEVVRKTTFALHFGMTGNPLNRAARKVVLPFAAGVEGVRERIARELSEVEVRYGESPLIERDSVALAKRSDLKPGTRARDASVFHPGAAEAVSLWRELLHAGFTLLLFSGSDPGAEVAGELQGLADRALALTDLVRPLTIWRGAEAPALHDCLLDTAGDAHRRYGAEEPAWYFIRPDQYVAARGTLGEIDLLRHFLLRVF